MLLRQPSSPLEIRRKGTREVAHRAAGPLSGADLRRADLRRCDLRKRNLAEVDLTGASLAGADLRKANLTNAILDGCDLSDADLRGARLNGARFRGAKLQRAQLPREIYEADFANADLQGARNPEAGDINRSCVRCTFDGASLRDTDLRGWVLEECSFKGADVRGARMRGIPLLRRSMLALLAQTPGIAPSVLGMLAPHSALTAIITRHHLNGSPWDIVDWGCLITGIWLILVTRPETTFRNCDLAGVRHGESTRWPKGFALRPAPSDHPCSPED